MYSTTARNFLPIAPYYYTFCFKHWMISRVLVLEIRGFYQPMLATWSLKATLRLLVLTVAVAGAT